MSSKKQNKKIRTRNAIIYFILRFFVIVSLVDVTVENAVSNLKTYLLKPEFNKPQNKEDSYSIFRSVFKIPDLRMGFTIYNEEEDRFEKPASLSYQEITLTKVSVK